MNVHTHQVLRIYCNTHTHSVHSPCDECVRAFGWQVQHVGLMSTPSEWHDTQQKVTRQLIEKLTFHVVVCAALLLAFISINCWDEETQMSNTLFSTFSINSIQRSNRSDFYCAVWCVCVCVYGSCSRLGDKWDCGCGPIMFPLNRRLTSRPTHWCRTALMMMGNCWLRWPRF